MKKANNVWEVARPLLKTNADAVAVFDGQPLTVSSGGARANSIADGLVQ